MALEDVIGSHATGWYVVTRTPSRRPTYVDGALVPADAGIELTITAVDATLDTLTSVGHGLATGAGPVRLLGTESIEYANGDSAPELPDPLTLVDEYWVIVVDADTIKLAESEAEAIAETAIDLTDAGDVPFIASSTRFMVEASVQPTSGRTLSADDESNRMGEDKLALVVEELFTQKPGRDPDSFEIDGEDWTVTVAERWDHWGGRHYECTISRDEVT